MSKNSPRIVLWITVVLVCFCMGVMATCIPWGGLKLRNPPLHDAAEAGDLAEVQRLISAGADPNARNSNGQTAIYFAILLKHFNVAEYLLSKGADINARDHSGRDILDDLAYVGMPEDRDVEKAWVKNHGGKL